MSEGDLSKAIRTALKLKGCRVIRIQSGIIPALYGTTKRFIHCAPNGTPDLLVIRAPGIYTWLEVKVEGGKLSKQQQEWHEWAVSTGLRVAVVRSVDDALRAVFGGRKLDHPAEPPKGVRGRDYSRGRLTAPIGSRDV